jgi:2',3'-cyclic-nucleotide 2'-phosphodiesterase (5'-nucleotidase family)
VLTANEGEPSEDYTTDPEGSVSIITLPADVSTVTNANVTTIGFTAFNQGNARYSTLISTTVQVNNSTPRVFGPGATVAQDFEPEYIAVSDDSSTAYVMLQENNAVAVVDLSVPEVTTVIGLGFKDFSQPENALDPSNSDGAINIGTWPVVGMYQPDAIAAYTVDSTTYLVSANEGDARDYDGFSEEVRVADLTLDDTAFPNSNLSDENQLGRLRVTDAAIAISGTEVISGDTDLDGEFEELYAYGARSFSIWNGTTGELVYDSANDFALIAAEEYPAYFNADFDNGAFQFDDRSDDKGIEPEGVALGEIDGRTYAFIGLERMGGIMIYDVTDPMTPVYVDYVNTADFENGSGNISPEGIIFIPGVESPTGNPMLVVSYEVSGTVVFFEVGTFKETYLPIMSTSGQPAGSTLTILHNNDGESAILPLANTVPPLAGYPNTSEVNLDVGSIAAFGSVAEREISDAQNAGHSTLMVYAGDAFLASATIQCSFPITSTEPVYDAIAQRQVPYDVHILGNHEFDYTPDFLVRFIEAFDDGSGLTQPFLGANLDFSGEDGVSDIDDFVDADGLLQTPITDGKVIGGSVIITDSNTSETFGVIGITPPYLDSLSSPRNVTVDPNTVQVVQDEVDRLESQGINKIILVSHLQDFSNDLDLISQLSGIDVAVGGGSDDFLLNSTLDENMQRLPGDDSTKEGEYPTEITDADGNTVYFVTGTDRYQYLGRLDVRFNAAGDVTDVILENSYPRRVIPDTAANAAAIAAVGVTDAVTPDSTIETNVNTPVQQCLTDLGNEPVAGTELVFDTTRDAARTRESAIGNLVADGFVFMYDEYAPTTAGGLPPRSTSNPVVGIQNGGGIRQNVGDTLPRDGNAPGIISRLDTIDLLPFDNTMRVVQNVTPTRLLELLDNRGTSGLYQVSGLELVYDTNTSGDSTVYEIDSITLINPDNSTVLLVDNGAVVAGQENTEIDVVTNSYVGNNDIDDVTTQVDLTDTGGGKIFYEQSLREYLQDTTNFPETDQFGVGPLPTIDDQDQRYQPNGEGRITFQW